MTEHEIEFHGKEYKDTGLGLLKHDMLRDSLNTNFNEQQKTLKNNSLIVFGDTGIGKSTAVTDFCEAKAKELGLQDAPKHFGQKTAYLDFDKLTEAQIDEIMQMDRSKFFFFKLLKTDTFFPTDYEGVPLIPKNGNKELGQGEQYQNWLKQLKFPFIRFMETVAGQPPAQGVLFLDEINHATPDLLNYFYIVIEDHKFGSTKVSDKIFIAAAGNIGSSGGSSTQELATSLKSRFYAKGYLILDPDTWIKYSKNVGVDPRVIAFIQTDPWLYLGQENVVDPSASKKNYGLSQDVRNVKQAFATPRSVERFSNKYKTLLKNYNDYKDLVDQGKASWEDWTPLGERKIGLEEASYLLAKETNGKDWADDWRTFIKAYESYSLKGLVQKGESMVGSKRYFRSSEAPALEQYGIPNFLLTHIIPITTKMWNMGKDEEYVDEHGIKQTERVPAVPEAQDARKLQAIVKIICFVKYEVQTLIIDTFRDPRELNAESFGTFLNWAKNGYYDPKIKKEFLEEIVPRLGTINKKLKEIEAAEKAQKQK
jgi:hypothetical protein